MPSPCASLRSRLSFYFSRLFTLCLLALGVCFAPLTRAATGPARGILLDVASLGHNLFAVGERGRILRSGDGGHSWESLSSPTDAALTAITFADPQHGWAVGHDGLILHSSDQGETWAEQFRAPDPEAVFLDIAALTPRHLIAIGAFGLCYETHDSGKHWSARPVPSADNHLNRATPLDSTLFIAGERGTLLRLTADTAAAIPTPYEGSFYGILPLGGDTLLAYGLRGHLFRSEDRGASWTAIPSPVPMQLFTALRLKNKTLVIAGSHGRTFLVSFDDGLTFSLWPTSITTCVSQIHETANGRLLVLGETGATLLPAPETPATPPSP